VAIREFAPGRDALAWIGLIASCALVQYPGTALPQRDPYYNIAVAHARDRARLSDFSREARVGSVSLDQGPRGPLCTCTGIYRFRSSDRRSTWLWTFSAVGRAQRRSRRSRDAGTGSRFCRSVDQERLFARDCANVALVSLSPRGSTNSEAWLINSSRLQLFAHLSIAIGVCYLAHPGAFGRSTTFDPDGAPIASVNLAPGLRKVGREQYQQRWTCYRVDSVGGEQRARRGRTDGRSHAGVYPDVVRRGRRWVCRSRSGSLG
jgi:hypothetical protein